MSSGWGSRGQMGRCFPVYQEFSDCVALGDKSACAELRDDYFECLHHNKEITRVNARSKKAYPCPLHLQRMLRAGRLNFRSRRSNDSTNSTMRRSLILDCSSSMLVH